MIASILFRVRTCDCTGARRESLSEEPARAADLPAGGSEFNDWEKCAETI